MYFILFNLIFLYTQLINANTGGGQNTINSEPLPTNDLGLTFDHQVNQRDNIVIIYFNITNATLKEYRYYYYDFRPFGSHSRSEYLPRQRLIDTHNSLRILGLHDGDYVICISFVNEYQAVLKARYACYEFTLGEKIVGSHHAGSSGYLAPLLFALAFILHVFIAIVHHIKAKNYAHRLLHRFIDVAPKSNKRKLNVNQSLRELGKELDHPHLPASVQRRLSRVTIDPNYDYETHNNEGFLTNDELPLYTLPHHSRRVSMATMEMIPEHVNATTLDSVSSMKHLIDSAPWIRRANRSISSSIRRKSQLHV
jgi:hypothetical protein